MRASGVRCGHARISPITVEIRYRPTPRSATRQTGAVNSRELRERAAALGVAVSYLDWRGHEVTVPDETLRAILAALGDPPPSGKPPLFESY